MSYLHPGPRFSKPIPTLSLAPTRHSELDKERHQGRNAWKCLFFFLRRAEENEKHHGGKRKRSRKPGDHNAESANLRRMLDSEEKMGLGRRENTHSYVSRHYSLCEKSVDCMNEQKWRTTRIFKASSCERKKPQILSWFNPVKVCFSLTERPVLVRRPFSVAGPSQARVALHSQKEGEAAGACGLGNLKGLPLEWPAYFSAHPRVPEPRHLAATSQGGREEKDGLLSTQEEEDGRKLAEHTPLPRPHGIRASAWHLGQTFNKMSVHMRGGGGEGN